MHMRSAFVFVVLLTLLTGVARAQPFPAIGDDGDLWLVCPELADKAVLILHRRSNDAPTTFRRVGRFLGGVDLGNLATGGGRLWIVYNNRSLQSLAFAPSERAGLGDFTRSRFEAPLPLDITVKGLAADRTGPWALVTVFSEVESASAEDGAAEPTPPARPEDQLLHLETDGWSHIDLPDVWAADKPSWLIMLRSTDAAPALISQIAPDKLLVHVREDKSWKTTAYDIEPSLAAGLFPVAVDGQLLLGRTHEVEKGVAVTIQMLRDGKVVTLGDLELSDTPTTRWTLAAVGQSVALIVLDAPIGGTDPTATARTPGILWRTMDLHGRAASGPVALTVETFSPFEREPGQLLVVIVVSLSMLMMFAIRRGDARLTLPKELVVADLVRRIMAAAIDLAPCVLAAIIIFGITLDDLTWPVAMIRWDDMIPRITVVALNVAHTLISEVFTGRTLGKFICGLRVTKLDGSPPDIWQAIIRNLLRAFDIIAWYVLPILMLISVNRQRLGDMVANTVVVADAVDEESEGDDDIE